MPRRPRLNPTRTGTQNMSYAVLRDFYGHQRQYVPTRRTSSASGDFNRRETRVESERSQRATSPKLGEATNRVASGRIEKKTDQAARANSTYKRIHGVAKSTPKDRSQKANIKPQPRSAAVDKDERSKKGSTKASSTSEKSVPSAAVENIGVEVSASEKKPISDGKQSHMTASQTAVPATAAPARPRRRRQPQYNPLRPMQHPGRTIKKKDPPSTTNDKSDKTGAPEINSPGSVSSRKPAATTSLATTARPSGIKKHSHDHKAPKANVKAIEKKLNTTQAPTSKNEATRSDKQ